MNWKGRSYSREAREHRGGEKGWAQRNSPRVGGDWTQREGGREREEVSNRWLGGLLGLPVKSGNGE